jgi:hypothetical protein
MRRFPHRTIVNFIAVRLGFVQPRLLEAQAMLENPAPDSFQSGGVISGWVCQARQVLNLAAQLSLGKVLWIGAHPDDEVAVAPLLSALRAVPDSQRQLFFLSRADVIETGNSGYDQLCGP